MAKNRQPDSMNTSQSYSHYSDKFPPDQNPERDVTSEAMNSVTSKPKSSNQR
jgi:hypothetical protein